MHSSLIQTAELYAKPILGIREDDVVFSAAKLFFAYGLGNALTFPLAVGATDGADGRAADAGGGVRAPAQAPADDLLRRADAVRGAAREPRPAGARTSSSLRALHVGRRGAAGGDRQALDRRTSASRSSTASARPRCCTSSCRTGRATCATAPPARRCPATSCASSATTASRSRRARSASCRSAGRPRAIGYWNNREKSRDDVPRPVDAQRRQVLDRRGRLLHLRRPHRRHAEGRAASTSRRSRSRRR